MQPDVVTSVKTPFCSETQGLCGSVRTCVVDTVTDDTSALVKEVTTHHPSLWSVFGTWSLDTAVALDEVAQL